jgi:hypothetical protein
LRLKAQTGTDFVGRRSLVMAKQPIPTPSPKPDDPDKRPRREPEPYHDPVEDPPFDPPDQRPLIDPQQPNTDRPRM